MKRNFMKCLAMFSAAAVLAMAAAPAEGALSRQIGRTHKSVQKKVLPVAANHGFTTSNWAKWKFKPHRYVPRYCPDPAVVPEPTGLLTMGGLFGLAFVSSRFLRRKRQ